MAPVDGNIQSAQLLQLTWITAWMITLCVNSCYTSKPNALN